MKGLSLLCAGILLLLGGCVSQELIDVSQKWDKWIGTSKDERVRELGIPNKCHSFKAGGEVCEWQMLMEGGRSETFGITFDPKGLACQWMYRGFYGERRSQASCS